MDELQEKKRRLLELMEKHQLDAICLSRVGNFAWYTGGAEPVIMLSSDRAEAALLIEPEHQTVLCNSVEYPRMRDEDNLEAHGYSFRIVPWYGGATDLDRLMQGKRWASDWPATGERDLSGEIARLRFELTEPEVVRYRLLGKRTGAALEKTARAVRPGMTEREIAGMLAAEALSLGVTPTLLLVGADDRIFRYRHPIPTPKAVEKYCMLVVCGRWKGLVASATRLVHFGDPDKALIARHRACAVVDATFNGQTHIGARVSDIFSAGAKAYADAGFHEEWKNHNQGGAAGYESRDYEATPSCMEVVLPEQAFAWNPSIAGVKSEDTMIVHAGEIEFLTTTGDWPVVNLDVAGRRWQRPAILDV